MRRSWAGAALAAAALAVLAPALLVGSPPDEEEYRFTILSTMLHARAFLSGSFLLWNPLLGLGMPHPLGQSLLLHPMMPLAAWLEPSVWARLVYVAHSVFGAWGMLRLARDIGLSPAVGGVCAATFLLATPVQNYALSDFWPSGLVGWTLLPWLVVAILRVLDEDRPRVALWRGIVTGALAGLFAANGHPGYSLLCLPAFLAFWVTNHRRVMRHPGAWALAVLVALVVVAPVALRLLDERQAFDPALARFTWSDTPTWHALWDALPRPLAPPGERWDDFTLGRGTRVVFLGAPFLILALVAVAQRHGPVATGFKLAAATALGLLVVPGLSIQLLPGQFLQRDPLIFFAIPLAGLALERLRRSWRPWSWRAIALLQMGQLTASAAIFVQQTISAEVRRVAPATGATAHRPLAAQLVEIVRSTGGRLAMSPLVDDLSMQRGLLADGLGINAVAYRDVPIVNGSFKGIATDAVHPSPLMFYGRIALEPPAIQSRATLAVLGITHVLAFQGERVADGLIEAGSFPSATGRTYVLWRHASAWPGASFIAPDIASSNLERLPGCRHDRLVCRDLAPVEQGRVEGVRTVERGANTLTVRMDPPSGERVLLVSEMYRPGWTASSAGRALRLRPVFGALIAVDVPAGIGEMRLEYRDRRMTAAWAAAYSTLALVAVTGLVRHVQRSRARRRSRHRPPA